jgi:hypothetical protein
MADRLLLYFAAVLSGKPSSKIVKHSSDPGGQYWDRTSDLFGVNLDWVWWFTALEAVLAGG